MGGPAGPLAVFDFGKTNSKLFVFSPEGEVISERRTKPEWIDYRGKKVLDDARLFGWVRAELAAAVEAYGVTGVMVSAHGCTFAYVRAADELMHPILDYEQEIPDHLAAEIDPQLPAFSESYTPVLPLGFSIVRHMYWLEKTEPVAVSASDAVLLYPQFWCWRLGGRKVSEWSYVGAHNQLWAPLKGDFTGLVAKLGWRSLFPVLVPAGTVIGEASVTLSDGSTRAVAIHNGAHDSNAALAYYRMTGLAEFTIVSTGTWVIIINLDCPLDALDKDRDMLANTTVLGEPAPTLRFMGGREYDLISQGWNKPISQSAVDAVMARGVFAMPSWTAGGPFPETHGEIVGGEIDGEELAAVAALYVVLMTDLSLDLIRSEKKIVVDGGLAKMDLYTSMLAQLRTGQTVVKSAMSEGSATGAAAIAFDALGSRPFRDETSPVAPGAIVGLEEYRDRWRALAEARRLEAQTGKAVAHG